MDSKDYFEEMLKDPKYKKDIEKYKKSLEYQLNMFMFEARINGVLTQEKLAKKIGTQQPSVARVESANYIPNLRFLDKIAKACKGHIEIKFVSDKKN